MLKVALVNKAYLGSNKNDKASKLMKIIRS